MGLWWFSHSSSSTDGCDRASSKSHNAYPFCGLILSTSFYLAEYRVDGTQQVSKGAPVLEAGQRVWKYYSDIEFDNDCFFDIGRDLENTGHVKVSKVGSAQTKLLSVKNAVDFAVDWLTTHPR